MRHQAAIQASAQHYVARGKEGTHEANRREKLPVPKHAPLHLVPVCPPVGCFALAFRVACCHAVALGLHLRATPLFCGRRMRTHIMTRAHVYMPTCIHACM